MARVKYSEKFINKVIKESDILVMAISDSKRFTKIKPLANKRFNINCIFHDDSHPSMIIDCKTNSFHCLATSCRKKGDIIGFVMQMYNLDYISAVQLLALSFDVELPKHDYVVVSKKLIKRVKNSRENENYKELMNVSEIKTKILESKNIQQKM